MSYGKSESSTDRVSEMENAFLILSCKYSQLHLWVFHLPNKWLLQWFKQNGENGNVKVNVVQSTKMGHGDMFEMVIIPVLIAEMDKMYMYIKPSEK